MASDDKITQSTMDFLTKIIDSILEKYESDIGDSNIPILSIKQFIEE